MSFSFIVFLKTLDRTPIFWGNSFLDGIKSSYYVDILENLDRTPIFFRISSKYRVISI